jgi:hypothetical protein
MNQKSTFEKQIKTLILSDVKGLKLSLLVVFFEGQYYHPDNLGAGTGLQFSTDDGNRKICFGGKTKI